MSIFSHIFKCIAFAFLLPSLGLAQYEYLIPKTEISSRSGYTFSKNHLVLVFVAENSGIGRLRNGCGYDTLINYKGNELVTVGIPHPMGRLFSKDKEKVTNCNFILETTTPAKLNCYLNAPESTGAYSIL